MVICFDCKNELMIVKQRKPTSNKLKLICIELSFIVKEHRYLKLLVIAEILATLSKCMFNIIGFGLSTTSCKIAVAIRLEHLALYTWT